MIARAFAVGTVFVIGAVLAMAVVNRIFGPPSVQLVDEHGNKIDRAGLIRSRPKDKQSSSDEAPSHDPGAAILSGLAKNGGKPPSSKDGRQ